MPEIVALGIAPMIQACARFHLPNGNGHPEPSSVAALPAEFMLRQMNASKTRQRWGVRADRMEPFTKEIAESDLAQAIGCFGNLKPARWIQSRRNERRAGNVHWARRDEILKAYDKCKSLNARITIVPEDPERVELDAHSGFIEYVATEGK